MMKFKRAQLAVELIAILAVAAIVLIVIFVLAFQTIQNASQMNRDEAAAQSLDRLSYAVQSTYAQGNGSQKVVPIVIPGDVFGTFVTRTTFGYNYSNSDGAQYVRVRSPNVNMSGSLPTTPGTYYINVSSNGRNVTFSYS
jgi:type II secretory pathway pseudopilin PulG